jgi:transcriptional regulator with XRE-family HTH domain
VDDTRLGAVYRAIRLRKRLRQLDVAQRSGVEREVISRLERGSAGRIPLHTLGAVASALGIRIDVVVQWPGGDLDRVLNHRHAALHEAVAAFFGSLPGWVTAPEVSFSIYGERGVIDILAWHEASRSLLIIELKTALVDPQELVATMDRRTRLARQIGRERGWSADSVSCWVIVAESSTNQRRVREHRGLLRTAFPATGHAIRAWLQHPGGGRISGLSFWSDVAAGPASRVSSQVRRVRKAPGDAPASVAIR